MKIAGILASMALGVLACCVIGRSQDKKQEEPTTAELMAAKVAFAKIGFDYIAEPYPTPTTARHFFRAPEQATDDDVKKLTALSEIPFAFGLQLYNTRVTDKGLAEMKRTKNLTALYLGATQVTNAGVKELKNIQDLKELNVSGTSITAAGLRELRDLDNLTALIIDIRQAAKGGLTEVGTLKNLKTLHIEGTLDVELKFEDLKGLKNLTLLVLDGKYITDSALKTLREINLLHAWSHTEVKGRGRPTSPNEVTDLGLARTRVTDAGLKEIRIFTNLSTLYLGGSAFTDAGLEELKELQSIGTLYLADTRVTSAGLAKLSAFQKLSAIKLSGEGVTDSELRGLQSVKTLTALTLFETKATEDGVQKLHEALPGCKITFRGLVFRKISAGQSKGLELLRGSWEVTEVEPKEDGPQFKRLIFDGNKLIVVVDEMDKKELRIWIDPAVKPAQIDIADDRIASFGIYEVSGDTIRICLSKSPNTRPTAFKTGQNVEIMITLKREKK